jgi:hypothetical protein
MTPFNPKLDKRLRNKSFSQHMIEKSDSIVLVPGKSVATNHNIPSDSGIEHQVKTSHP